MKKIWILLALALVLLFLGLRERFGETENIKKPPLSAGEVTRAKGMYVRESNWTWPALTDAEVKQALEGFWPTWESAQSQITMAQVTGYAAGLSPPEKRAEYIELLKKYYIEQGQSVFSAAYQSVISGGTTGTTESPAEPSAVVRTRPGPGDQRLRGEVASYTGLPTNNPMIDTVIGEMGRFYDSVYVPGGKKMPSQSDIQSFVMQSTAVPADRKSGLTSAIDYWFTQPASPGDPRVEGGSPPPAPPPGTTTAGAVGGPASGGLGVGTSDSNIWGPPLTGTGAPRNWSEDGSGGSMAYPTLLGPPRESSSLMAGVGVVPSAQPATLPPSTSTGSDPMAAFLPFSRQPGDQERIPDPYRVSQSYSASSYSSKNEPVPFLTDFSAFLK